jgi:endo-1,4-beta-mannosidase
MLSALAAAADETLPRIGVRKPAESPAEFYRTDTGTRFTPVGFNHTVLGTGPRGWHATFNTDTYDPEAMESTLSRMAALGANTVRVWVWGTQDEAGFTGARDGAGLNPAYMANIIDFLRRCTAHGIHAVAILDHVPGNAGYRAIGARADAEDENPAVEGYNRQYLTRGSIEAKAAAAADFVRHIREADPRLLNAVLGWSLANEVCVRANLPPFSNDAGTARNATGATYDLSDTTARQALYDEGILYWVNTLTAAIKREDPDALVTAGMWTSDAHGRPPVNGVRPDGGDPRFPPRPSVLGGPDSALDFIDVHIYPWDGTATVRADAHERDLLAGSAKAAIVGEYGVFKNKPADEAKTMMRAMLEQAVTMGYRGGLHWVWDLTETPGQTWSAVEEDIGAYVMGLRVWPE